VENEQAIAGSQCCCLCTHPLCVHSVFLCLDTWELPSPANLPPLPFHLLNKFIDHQMGAGSMDAVEWEGMYAYCCQ
jgi:hypothetical protein